MIGAVSSKQVRKKAEGRLRTVDAVMHRTPGVSAQDNGDEFDDDTRDLDSNLDDDLEVDVVTPRPKSLGAIRAARRNKKMVGSRIVGSGLENSEDLKTFSNPLKPGDRTPSPTRFDMFGTRNMWRDDLPAPTLNKARMCIMHPESTYKHLQDICLITVLIIYGIAVPYRWAFDAPPSGWGIAFDFWCEPILLVDLLLRFRTAYFEHEMGLLVDEPGMIARYYLRNGAILDICSALPMELINRLLVFVIDVSPKTYPSGHVWTAWLICVRINQCGRIIRVYAHLAYIQDAIHWAMDFVASLFGTSMNYAVARILKLFLTVAMLAHWCGCLWYKLGLTSDKSGWVDFYKLRDEDMWKRYSASYFFVFTTITTVGYGDYCPQNMEERLFVIVLMCLGCTMFAYVVGLVGGNISGFDLFNMQIMQNQDYLDTLMKAHRVPGKLQRDVSLYYGHLSLHTEVYAKRNILQQLPYNLKRDLTLKLYGGLAIRTQSSLLKGAHKDFMYAVLNRLHPTVSGCEYGAFCVRGELAADLFFLHRGQVQIVFDPNPPESLESTPFPMEPIVIKAVEPFDSFGEESIAGHAKPTPRYVFNYVATAETELLFLTHEELHFIARTFVDETDELVGRVHGRFKMLYDILHLKSEKAMQGGSSIDVPALGEFTDAFGTWEDRPPASTATPRSVPL